MIMAIFTPDRGRFNTNGQNKGVKDVDDFHISGGVCRIMNMTGGVLWDIHSQGSGTERISFRKTLICPARCASALGITTACEVSDPSTV